MRCYVASDDSVLAGRIREALVELGYACPQAHVAGLDVSRKNLELRLKSNPAGSTMDTELIVLALAPDADKALSSLRDTRAQTTARILIVGATTDIKIVLRSIREGANEFIDQDDLAGELAAALARLSVAGPRGKLIAVLGPSGGTGCSTVAVNLAVAFAQKGGSSVVADLKLDTGDLSTLLDVKPQYTLAELCVNTRRLDDSLLEGCLVRHDSGVHLLAAPATIADSQKVTEEGIIEVLTLATHRFPYVVADLAGSFHHERQRVLQHANLILLVLRLDFTSLRNTRMSLEFLNASGVAPANIWLIVNHYGLPNEISTIQAEEALGMKITGFIPEDPKTVNRANNNGVPVILQAPSAKVSRALIDLATRIDAFGGH